MKSSSSSRVIAYAVWMIASIFYAYQYVLRVMPSIMLHDIMDHFQIGTGAFGQFSGVYYIGYSLMHLPIGIMLDRFGPKKVMSGCILTTVIGLLPLIFAHHWAYPIAGRILTGMGSSAAILGLFKIIRITFPEDRFSRMLSISVPIGLLGAIYGGAPISYMCEMMGYQSVIAIVACIGVVLSYITYCIVPDSAPQQSSGIRSNLREVLSNKKVIITCLSAGLMVGPIEGFADIWGTVFLRQVYGYDMTWAASLPSFIFIGMCFGAPILNMIAEKTKSYNGTIIGAGIIMAGSFFWLLFSKISPTFVSSNFIVIGMCSAYQILAIYKASTYVSEEVSGITAAIANMIIMTFGYIFHTVIGGIIAALGGASESNALIYGISIIPIALCLGVIGFSMLTIFYSHIPQSKKV